MKMIPVNIQLPERIDRALREEARRKLTSKSSIIRQILADHVNTQKEAPCQLTPSAQAQ